MIMCITYRQIHKLISSLLLFSIVLVANTFTFIPNGKYMESLVEGHFDICNLTGRYVMLMKLLFFFK